MMRKKRWPREEQKKAIPYETSKENLVLFWDVNAKYGVFCNWSLHVIISEGKLFFTVEHYFMYKKALAMGDRDTAEKVMKFPSPAHARRTGREIKNWNKSEWKKMKAAIMYDAIKLKATQHSDVRELLLSTGDAKIGEAHPLDKIWGIGAGYHEAMKDPKTHTGDNLLGELWMQLRSEIRENMKIGMDRK